MNLSCPSSKFSLGFEHQGSGKEQLIRWQGQVRAKLLDLIHYPTAQAESGFCTVSSEKKAVEGVEQIRHLVQGGGWAPQPIYEFLPPDNANRGTLITFHGHGKDPFTDIYTYVRELARHGYRVFMPILFGKMERATKGPPEDPNEHCGVWSVDADALGSTLLGLRLFDGSLAYRFAQSLPGVDSDRIGTIGLSMGGELALYLAAIQPNIRVCVSAGFLSTFKSLLFDRGNCPCYSIRDWPRHFDMPDIVGAIAPRPLQIQKGYDDPCFDSDDVQRAYERVAGIYGAFGAADLTRYETCPGRHCLHVDKAEAWFAEHLVSDHPSENRSG